MRRQLLSAVAAAALITGPAWVVQAQDAEQPAAAQEVCPPDQCPPQGGGAEAPAAAPEQQPADQMQPAEPAEGQAVQEPLPEGGAPAEGQAVQEPLPEGAEPAEGQAAQEPQPEGAEQAPPDQMQAEQPQDGDEPTQTGSVNANVEINEQQATEIRTVVKEVDVDRVDVDIDIDIGVRVPRTVVLHPLPPRIVKIVPAYADYEFFILADGTIVIVDPVTFEIVYVLYA